MILYHESSFSTFLRFNQQSTQAVMSNQSKSKDRLLLLESLAKLCQDDIDVQILTIKNFFKLRVTPI
jgi:hypothetical protein